MTFMMQGNHRCALNPFLSLEQDRLCLTTNCIIAVGPPRGIEWIRGLVSKGCCIKVSPIESILQYCFATSKPLKTSQVEDRCETAPLCNRVRVEIPPPLQFPLSLINSESPGSARSRQGREARQSRSLDGETRAVQSRAQGKGGFKGRVAAAEPPSIRALDSEIPRFLFSQG